MSDEKKSLGGPSPTAGVTAGSIDTDAASHVAPLHTPGPWRVTESSESGEESALGVQGTGAHDWFVADVWLNIDSEATARANAHLIAAAPELLEYARLEEAVEDFDCPHDAEARCDCGPRQDALFRRARQLRKQALTKAEGR